MTENRFTLGKIIFTVVILFSLVIFGSVDILAAPRIEIPNHEFSFGKTLQQVGLSHSFWIKSVGEDTLRIIKIVPGCGCTKAPVTDTLIAPGDSTRMDITFATGSYRGYVSKKPYLLTNAGNEKTYVKIHAQVFPNPEDIGPIKLSPLAVDVSQITEKEVRDVTKFLIINPTEQDFEIGPVDIDNKSFDVKLPGKVKAGETVEAEITVHKDALDSEFFESITFAIDDDEMSTFSIAVGRRLLYKEPPKPSIKAPDKE